MPNQIVTQLKISIKRKQKKNPQYSLRLLARRIGLSSSFLSQVLSGKKNFPIERLDSLVQELELDEFAQGRMFDAIVDAQRQQWSEQSETMAKLIGTAFPSKKKKVRVYNEVPSSKMNLLNPWYNAALLDLISSEDFQVDFSWMARRLGITPQQAHAAWSFLKDNQFIIEHEGRWKKDEQYLRIPVKNSSASLREHYREILAKIDQQLKTKTSPSDVKRRLIIGASCTANLKKFDDVCQYLEESLYLAAEELSEDPCQEVFYLMVSAIPLTHRD